jgi:hypothetical protein
VSRRGGKGTCYELCWAETPYCHAGHYLGFAYEDSRGEKHPDWAAWHAAIMAAARIGGGPRLTPARIAGLADRLAQHAAGEGAVLTAALVTVGIEFRLVRVWPGTTEQHEKALKDLNNRKRLCPNCNPGTRAGVNPVPKRYRRRRPKPSPAMRKSPLAAYH